jgi:asparagine synthase (glutamine-hydrolysing)
LCGICGIVLNDPAARVDEQIVRAMTATLVHRGPDDEGYYFSGGVGIGMRRLCVIDPDGGQQPCTDESGKIVVVQNGEIYNFREHMDRLKGKGHRFKSRVDTEVVAHLFEEEGAQFVTRLNGMFAIAIWDERDRTLHLARDRFGIKPLYYSVQPEGIYFASEPKAILAAGVSRAMNFAALSEFLGYNYIAGEQSIWDCMQRVLPGCQLTFRNGTARTRRYWDLPVNEPSLNGRKPRIEALEEELVHRLKKTIAGQMVSDVPLGVFLSGGSDTGTVTAMLSELSDVPVKAFSVGFEEASFNEIPDAARTSARCGADHYPLVVKPRPNEVLPKLFDMYDEPHGDSTAIPNWYIAEFARRHVTVCLAGDGGDEVFGGYHTYVATHLAQKYQRLPGLLSRTIIPAIVERLPVSHERVSFDYKAKRFVRNANKDLLRAHGGWKSIFSTEWKREILQPDVLAALEAQDRLDSFPSKGKLLKHAEAGGLLAQLQYCDLNHYLPENNLARADRMSMAVSLEVRVPLLDHELATWVINLPPEYRVNGSRKKILQKKAMESRLPHEVLYGRKRGFNTPMPGWLLGEMKGTMLDLLSDETLHRQGIFRPSGVRRFIDEHLTRKDDHSRQLYGMMMVTGWFDRWKAEVPHA